LRHSSAALPPFMRSKDSIYVLLGIVTKKGQFIRWDLTMKGRDFTFPIGKVLSRSKKSISRFWRIFTFLGTSGADYKKCPSVCMSVCLPVCLSSVEVVVRTQLSRSIWNSGCGLRMWTAVFIFRYHILIIKGSLFETITTLTLKRSKIV